MKTLESLAFIARSLMGHCSEISVWRTHSFNLFSLLLKKYFINTRRGNRKISVYANDPIFMHRWCGLKTGSKSHIAITCFLFNEMQYLPPETPFLNRVYFHRERDGSALHQLLLLYFGLGGESWL